MADYLPPRDAEYATWVANFNTQMTAHGDGLGFSAQEMADLGTHVTDWQTAYTAHLAARNTALARRQEKQLARFTLTEMVRPFVRRLQANPEMTDMLRAEFGITVPGTTPPLASDVPTTRPLVNVDTGQRLQHRLYWADELTPTSRRRPDGVRGAEIWAKIDGAPPGDPTELAFIATATKPQYAAQYGGEHSGKSVYYMVRWISNRGQPGPWSQTITATIVG